MFRPKMGAQTHQQKKKKNFIRKCIKMCGKSSTKSKKWKSLRAFQIHFHVDTELYLGSLFEYEVYSMYASVVLSLWNARAKCKVAKPKREWESYGSSQQ